MLHTVHCRVPFPGKPIPAQPAVPVFCRSRTAARSLPWRQAKPPPDGPQLPTSSGVLVNLARFPSLRSCDKPRGRRSGGAPLRAARSSNRMIADATQNTHSGAAWKGNAGDLTATQNGGYRVSSDAIRKLQRVTEERFPFVPDCRVCAPGKGGEELRRAPRTTSSLRPGPAHPCLPGLRPAWCRSLCWTCLTCRVSLIGTRRGPDQGLLPACVPASTPTSSRPRATARGPGRRRRRAAACASPAGEP